MPTAPASAPPPAAREAASPSRWLPVLAAFAIASVVAAFGFAAWQRQHREITALREEVASLRLSHRSASTRESLLRDANERAARAESALAALQRESAEAATRTAATQAEMERVIAFLRSEIDAAQETIRELQESRPPEPAAASQDRPDRPARGNR